jgi:O-antigen/teichoic acid export membrane protein
MAEEREASPGLSRGAPRDIAPSGESLPDSDAPSAKLTAVRNALKLGSSLLFTWGIALGTRFMLTRYLGPTRYGALNFADGFTTAAFIVLGLGADSYIRKEVSVRPAHASDFFGGMEVLRVGLTAAVMFAMLAVLHATHRPEEYVELVLLYGVTQFFVNANATLSAILHAKGRVGGMSVLAVATKVVWAGGVIVGMVLHAPLWVYALSYLASEFPETWVLYFLAHKHVGLRFRVDLRATGAMLLASLPYNLNLFATTAYGKLDISLLEFMGNTEEVGWYGAANSLAQLTLLVTPLIGWVLMPMFARAAARSRDELYEQIRRALELIMSVAMPAALMLFVGADVWLSIFGPAFAPAAPALRILAPMFIVMYVGIIYSIAIIMLERPWALVMIATGGLVVNVGLNLAFIGVSMRVLGPGGGGTGCAAAMLGTEIFVTACMVILVGRGGFDRRSSMTIVKSLAACGIVIALDRLVLAPIGWPRLLVDGAVYLALVLGTGALRLREIVSVMREAVRRRQQQSAG